MKTQYKNNQRIYKEYFTASDSNYRIVSGFDKTLTNLDFKVTVGTYADETGAYRTSKNETKTLSLTAASTQDKKKIYVIYVDKANDGTQNNREVKASIGQENILPQSAELDYSDKVILYLVTLAYGVSSITEADVVDLRFSSLRPFKPSSTFKIDASGNLDIDAGKITNTMILDGTITGAKLTGALANRMTPRTSSAASGNITPNLNTANVWIRTELSGDITINNPSNGVVGDVLVFLIKDDGTTRTLTWDTYFKPFDNALPASSISTKWLVVTAILVSSNYWATAYSEEL